MSRSRFASHISFEALPVEDVEDVEDDEEPTQQPTTEVVESQSDAPVEPQPAQQKRTTSLKTKERKSKKSKSKSPNRVDANVVVPVVPVEAVKAVEIIDVSAPLPKVPSEKSTNGHVALDVPLIEVNGVPLPVGPQPGSQLPQAEAEGCDDPTEEPVLVYEPPATISSVPPDQKEPKPSDEAERLKKHANVVTRTLWTLIMISGFLFCLALGHAFMIILVMVCQTLAYREVTALFSGVSKTKSRDVSNGKDPWSKTLNWYFFAVANYFLYGESLIYYFKHVVFADAQLLPFATNHRIISFALYLIGFIGFVMSLQKQYLKSQFGLFCWVHMSLLVIVVSSHFIINNIFEGLIWFWVPASLVICNDVFAYIFGIAFGRTPLIQLSPKKTVEGFVGAFFSTIVFGLVWGTLFMRFDYMICPAHNLGATAFSPEACQPNDVFVWRELQLWAPLRVFASALLRRTITVMPWAPYHIHLLIMSCFASLASPFGGFFASGFKRAFNIKDFGDSIPGHGGMTDRMDCQFLMGVFTYVYYSSLIKEHHVTVGSVLQTIVSNLTLEEQLELLSNFKSYLAGRGVQV